MNTKARTWTTLRSLDGHPCPELVRIPIARDRNGQHNFQGEYICVYLMLVGKVKEQHATGQCFLNSEKLPERIPVLQRVWVDSVILG